MYIHYNKAIKVNKVVILFCQKQPQRKNFGTILEWYFYKIFFSNIFRVIFKSFLRNIL